MQQVKDQSNYLKSKIMKDKLLEVKIPSFKRNQLPQSKGKKHKQNIIQVLQKTTRKPNCNLSQRNNYRTYSPSTRSKRLKCRRVMIKKPTLERIEECNQTLYSKLIPRLNKTINFNLELSD
jgi:hypothetical protein